MDFERFMLGVGVSAVGLFVFGLVAIGVGELVHEAVRGEPSSKDIAAQVRTEQNKILTDREFEKGIRPELNGRLFIVGENTRLVHDTIWTLSAYYIRAGSCVKALRVSTYQIEFDVKVPAKYGATRDTTRPAPNGTCKLTPDPTSIWPGAR